MAARVLGNAPSARARTRADALTWLENAGLIHRAYGVEIPRHPLKASADRSSFKVYALDVGLLGAPAETPVRILMKEDQLFSGYHGAFVGSFVAQQIRSSLGLRLYYWRTLGRKAELDFLLETRVGILPLELKAGVNPKSKSLRPYDEQFSPHLLTRTTLLNMRCDGRILNVPLYAAFRLPEFVALVIDVQRSVGAVGSGAGAVAFWLRFQPPPHQTQHADFPHCAFLQASRQGL